ncbi:phage holin family protein [Tetragenococcus halophilus]|uniref:Phage holin family protein n=1 Tax=Tetragenococcus halophilus TaxID=51669 RepID=A0AB35HMJ2_TETHA|nr:phage holin family protein [Tetragenococcus halophilus]MCO8288321.1 phage holin family protein [Tetragenococcus halophilus]MCO8292023.1 phage holin family protein [Tetragenococcus halophilus]MCO8294703.1 phage holin family protein [Tetragenococcus halophilus]MCO8297284.1 phage holin family protein [Tetragenococcus halophilus]
MDLNDYLIPIIVVACLIVGYVIRVTPSLQPAREYIPLIVCILGAVLGAVIQGVAVEAIIMGAVSGLASTGLNQVFRKTLNLKDGASK